MTTEPGRIILETQRLLLREFMEDDVEAFFLLGSHPRIIRYTGDPGGGFRSREHALEALRSHPLADYAKYGYGRLAVIDRGSQQVIGFAGLKYLEDLEQTDIGYRLLPEYWGRGLATEACRPLVRLGFDQLGLEEIIAFVHPDNRASARVLEKLGLALEGPVDFDGMPVLKYFARSAHLSPSL